MNKKIHISLFCYLIFQVISIVPEWDLDSAGEDLLGTDSEKTFDVTSRELYKVKMTFKKKLTKDNSGIKITNLLTLDEIEKEVPFD